MRLIRRCAGAAIALSFGLAMAASGEVSDSELRNVSLGVAAFQTSGPPGMELPDLATLLADRIGTSGVARVVGPGQLESSAQRPTSPSAVMALSSSAEVDGIVFGQTTQIGNHISVDVRLFSGASGDLVGTYIVEITRGSETAAAVERLAVQVIEGAGLLASAMEAARRGAGGDNRAVSNIRVFDNSAPISIKSNSLEATVVDGRRRLVFIGDVRVVQDDVNITANELTADYPKNSSQPSRLVAMGSVRVVQGTQEARCDRGTYERSDELLVCCGNAVLVDGENRVRGSCIEFDLTGETVRVKDATVSIAPKNTDGDFTGSRGERR